MIPTVTVVAHPVGYLVYCTTHGLSGAAWIDAASATYDAIGHAAAHHGPRASIPA